ncbi:L,D-transpeptidase family protein [Niabella yanshanensis]|uniref:L,D-transpeptidase family protein n=2 Tax=Niabella yanshanensis TaxID=577386 RepID=A0ABZ0W8F5_9BACT|nr:L,D-transpeptidase family protein [Niabella yanshanensis]
MMKNIFWIILVILGSLQIQAQTSVSSFSNAATSSFVTYQMGFQRPRESFARKEANLKALFEVKNLKWPARYMYIRSFKYDSQLEVWVKNTVTEPYKLLKIYKVCALVGTLGPKRFEGDYQVPEGFYHINEFNPNSAYYLSLGLNYPNASDRVLSDPVKPGGDIYIHGGCATVGCIPIKDDQIDELYVLTASSKSVGLDFIPVHIFPIKYDVKKSYDYLGKLTKDNKQLKDFSDPLEDAYDYFEKYKQIPIVMIKDDGQYVVNNALPKVPKFQPLIRHRPKATTKPIVRNIELETAAVAKWPEFPGGTEAYTTYLKQLGKDMTPSLPDSVTHTYAQVEFIVDKDGAPVNFKIIRGLDKEFNDMLIEKMEQMPKWAPAIYREKPVAKKMVQTVTVGIN